MLPATRFARNGDLRIAHQVVEGPWTSYSRRVLSPATAKFSAGVEELDPVGPATTPRKLPARPRLRWRKRSLSTERASPLSGTRSLGVFAPAGPVSEDTGPPEREDSLEPECSGEVEAPFVLVGRALVGGAGRLEGEFGLA